MGRFRLDRLLDSLISTELLVGMLWLGLAALTIALLVLTRTRWGQSRPLRKCVVLSLLAHVLLVGYATTVQIVTSNPLEAREPVIQISIADGDRQHEPVVEDRTFRERPWESFLDAPTLQPSPLETARLESAGISQPQRQTQSDPHGLFEDPPLERLPLDEAVRPEPEVPPADADLGTSPTGKPAELIEAPAARRHDGADSRGPVPPELQRRTHDSTPSAKPVRESHPGLPEALLEQTLPVPTMRDVPTTPDPRDSLADTADSMRPPSRGAPADRASPPEPIETISRSDIGRGTGIGPADSRADHLRPPSIATRGSPSEIGSDEANPVRGILAGVGPPFLPIPRRDRVDREVPDIYRLRVAPDRSRLVERFGATAETEKAVRAALKWLADNQEPAGRWSAKHHGGGRELMVAGRDRQSAGIEADMGMTGLALLAFLASGHTHQEGLYNPNVRRGLEYLISQQRRDGGLGGRATTFAYMYCHAMATFALSEAYGMTGDRSLRDAVHRAATYTLSAQNHSSGGWRYYPGDPGDTSQLGWQLMALKSAQLAGIPMPDYSRQGMIRFLDSVSSGEHGGLAAYRPREKISRAMTAEALACRQFLGMPPDHPAGREAGDYLLGELPGEGAKNLYYWYYGTLAMYQLQGGHWSRWNQALRNTLLGSQRKTGPLAGSWDPDTVWGGYGGRVYSTALAAMCLEVYYRFLPLYVEVSSQSQPPR